MVTEPNSYDKSIGEALYSLGEILGDKVTPYVPKPVQIAKDPIKKPGKSPLEGLLGILGKLPDSQ